MEWEVTGGVWAQEWKWSNTFIVLSGYIFIQTDSISFFSIYFCFRELSDAHSHNMAICYWSEDTRGQAWHSSGTRNCSFSVILNEGGLVLLRQAFLVSPPNGRKFDHGGEGWKMYFYMCKAVTSVYLCYHTFIEDTVRIKISKRLLRAVSKNWKMRITALQQTSEFCRGFWLL